jgi:periplasmic protein TonB
MREGRVFAYAVLASIALHALLLAALPGFRELSALIPDEPEPLIARVERLQPPPAKPEAREPPAPKPAAKREEKPAPPPPLAARLEPIVIPPPVAPAEPAPLAQAPAPPPAPAPLTRIDPRLLVPEPPAPDPERSGALERYREDLVRVASDFKRYPRVAVDNNWEGEVLVRLAVGADGRIASLGVARGSGYEVLDRQALQMFEAAKPLVEIPPALRGKAFELELRAIYNLRDQRSG